MNENTPTPATPAIRPVPRELIPLADLWVDVQLAQQRLEAGDPAARAERNDCVADLLDAGVELVELAHLLGVPADHLRVAMDHLPREIGGVPEWLRR